MKIKADKIDFLPAGSRVLLRNQEWVRMEDSITHHTEGYVFNPLNGEYWHWSHMVYLDDDVELIFRADGPSQGVDRV